MLVKNMYVNSRRYNLTLKDFVLFTDAHADKTLYVTFPVILDMHLQAFSSLCIWGSCYCTSASWQAERTTGYRYSYWCIDYSFKCYWGPIAW